MAQAPGVKFASRHHLLTSLQALNAGAKSRRRISLHLRHFCGSAFCWRSATLCLLTPPGCWCLLCSWCGTGQFSGTWLGFCYPTSALHYAVWQLVSGSPRWWIAPLIVYQQDYLNMAFLSWPEGLSYILARQLVQWELLYFSPSLSPLPSLSTSLLSLVMCGSIQASLSFLEELSILRWHSL